MDAIPQTNPRSVTQQEKFGFVKADGGSAERYRNISPSKPNAKFTLRVASKTNSFLGAAGAAYSVAEVLENPDPAHLAENTFNGVTAGAYIGNRFGGAGTLIGAFVGGIFAALGSLLGPYCRADLSTDAPKLRALVDRLKSIGFLDAEGNIVLGDGSRFRFAEEIFSNEGEYFARVDGLGVVGRQYFPDDRIAKVMNDFREQVLPLSALLTDFDPWETEVLTSQLLRAVHSSEGQLDLRLGRRVARRNLAALWEQLGLTSAQVDQLILSAERDHKIISGTAQRYLRGVHN